MARTQKFFDALKDFEEMQKRRAEAGINDLGAKQAQEALKPAQSLQRTAEKKKIVDEDKGVTVLNIPEALKAGGEKILEASTVPLNMLLSGFSSKTDASSEITPTQKVDMQKPGGALKADDSPVMSVADKMASEMQSNPAETISLAVNKAPEAAKKLLDQQSAPDPVKNAAAEVLSDRQRLSSKLDEIQAKKQNNQELGLVDQFVESMAFFLPTALGALVGGAIEGTAGAVAGAQQATGLAQAKREFDLKKEEQQRKNLETIVDLTSSKGSKLQQAQDLVTTSGKKVAFDPAQGYVYVDTLKKVDPRDKLVNLQQQRFEAGEVRRNQELNRRLAKEEQLSDKQVTTLTDIDIVEDQILRGLQLGDLLKDTGRGPVEGRVENWLIGLGVKRPEQLVALQSELSSTIANYIRAISGAQASEKEVERLRGIVGELKDDPKNFTVKMKRFLKELEDRRNATIKGIVRGQSLKAKSAKRFLRNESLVSGGKKPPGGKMEVTRGGKEYKWDPSIGKYRPKARK